MSNLLKELKPPGGTFLTGRTLWNYARIVILKEQRGKGSMVSLSILHSQIKSRIIPTLFILKNLIGPRSFNENSNRFYCSPRSSLYDLS